MAGVDPAKILAKADADIARLAGNGNPPVYGFSIEPFIARYRSSAEMTRAFVHVREGVRANLTSPFVAYFNETERTEFHRDDMWIRRIGLDDPNTLPIPADAAGIASAQLGDGFHNHTLDVAIFRSDADGKDLGSSEIAIQQPAPEEWDSKFWNRNDSSQKSVLLSRSSFDALYKEYSHGGKGREDWLSTFQKEDRDAADRTTHFVIRVNGKVVAHIQAQHSFDPAQPLNLESHFGKVERKAGELVVELGRLTVLQYEEMSPELANAVRSFGGRDYIRTLLFQKSFSWINNDAKASRVVMQVNGKGRDHLFTSKERGFGQWQFDDQGRHVVNEPDRQEWVLAISGQNLLRTEDQEMLSLLKQDQAKVSNTSSFNYRGLWYDPSIKADIMTVFIRENEMPAIQRLTSQGQLPNLVQRRDFPRQNPSHSNHAVVEFGSRTSYLYFRIP